MAARQLGFQASARRLFDLLLRPAAEQHCLLEKLAVAYAPSLTVMREMMRKRSSETSREGAPRLLAMANPVLAKQTSDGTFRRGHSFAPLPNAETEAKAVS